MANKRLLIAYYTGKGSTKKMAEAIGKGAKERGVDVKVIRVKECGINDLVEADGIIIGSPTYFSNVAWQVKKIIDESIALYSGRQLGDKVGGCFTSSGTLRDGKDCIKMLELAFGLHHRVKMVPGIIRVSGDGEKEVSEKCRQYGMAIAKELL